MPENKDWRDVTRVFITKKNMFMQNAMKEMATGVVNEPSAGSLGQVFEWDKQYKGKVGLHDRFVSYATHGTTGITYELEFTAFNRFADNVTIISLVRGEIYKENARWQLFKESKQKLSNGRNPAVTNIKNYYHCVLRQGRQLH